jgi:hypothetical protein
MTECQQSRYFARTSVRLPRSTLGQKFVGTNSYSTHSEAVRGRQDIEHQVVLVVNSLSDQPIDLRF